MKRQAISTIVLAVAALTAGHAIAQDATPKSREQVRAELIEATRTGELVGEAETGRKLNQMFPGRYPASSAVADAKTRAEVKAELAEAARSGDLAVAGEYSPAIDSSSASGNASGTGRAEGKTREQVRAELREANRNGSLIVGDMGNQRNALNPALYPATMVN